MKPVRRPTRRTLRRAARGMTLIEIIVGITILAMIMAAVSVAVIPRLEESRRERAAMDIKTIESALKLYYAKKGNYPDTGAGLRVLVDTQILEKVPEDPWGTEYMYLNEGGKPVIVSYGRDKTAGGEGPDADVTSGDSKEAQN